MRTWGVVACLVGLLITAEAGAQVTQTACTITWTAPTTYEGGTMVLTEPVTSYQIYIQQALTPAPVPGTSTPIISVTSPTPGTAAPTSVSCTGASGLGPPGQGIMTGQNYAWVTATVAGGESAVSAPFPFTFSVAGPPPPTPARKSSPPTALGVH